MTTVLSSWTERQIAAGVLAPGARAMTPQDAAAQHNAAHALQPGDPGYLTAPAPARGQARPEIRTMVEDRTPHVWIGCLGCYNGGDLVGDWYDAQGADEITVAQVHAGSGIDFVAEGCEELWCLDHENLPVTDEMSPMEAARWGEVYAEVDERQWPAYCAWVRSGDYVTGGDDLPDTGEFEDRYCGEWPSFADYAYDYVHETCLLDGVSEEVSRYFDYSAHAHDLEMDYTVVGASNQAVYIFRVS